MDSDWGGVCVWELDNRGECSNYMLLTWNLRKIINDTLKKKKEAKAHKITGKIQLWHPCTFC